MAYRVTQFVETPNPNAVKCVLDASPAPDRPRAYEAGQAAADDPLASALLAIPGVRNILIHDGWITVGKVPETTWATLKPEIKRVLGSVS